jgi:hypothetical protein
LTAVALALGQAAADRLAQMRETAAAVPMGQRLIGLLGLATMLLIAWLMSYDRRRVPWRLVAAGWRCRACSACWC